MSSEVLPEPEGAVNAKELFEALAKEQGLTFSAPAPSAEPAPEPAPEGRPRKQYVSKNDRVNRELMRLALLRLKYIHENSFQPEIREAALEAARFLRVVIELNPDLFPGLLKQGGRK